MLRPVFFSEERRETIKSDKPELKATEIFKEIGNLWKDLSAEEKAVYEQKAKDDKDRFRDETEAYNVKRRANRCVPSLHMFRLLLRESFHCTFREVKDPRVFVSTPHARVTSPLDHDMFILQLDCCFLVFPIWPDILLCPNSSPTLDEFMGDGDASGDGGDSDDDDDEE